MSHRKYTTIDEYLASLTPKQLEIVSEIRKVFMSKLDTTESVKRDRLHFRFPNDMWFYLTADKKGYIIIGFSRGSKMVTLNPVLDGWFDEIMTVVGKVYIHDRDTIYTKALPDILDRVYKLPKGMGVL